MPAAKPDARATKRKVTMSRPIIGTTFDGNPIYGDEHAATDYVRPDFLDAYIADAKKRWGFVEVSSEPDAGPGGYHGATHVPAHLNHPLAGQVFPATEED